MRRRPRASRSLCSRRRARRCWRGTASNPSPHRAPEAQAMWMLSDTERDALMLSLKVSLWGVGLSLPLGILVAALLARTEFWGKSLFNGVIYLPLVLPPVVTGYFLLILFGRRGPIGAFLLDNFGVSLSFRWTGAALASAVMGFPLLVRAVRLSIEMVDRKLEQAAATLGANAIWIFLTVTLPL